MTLVYMVHILIIACLIDECVFLPLFNV